MADKHYFTSEELKEQVKLLDKYQQGSEEYKNQGLKIISSYCRQLILTNEGIKRGLELLKKYQTGVEVSRTELFDTYVLGTEANLITGGNGTHELLKEIWKKIYDKYDPEPEYLQAYVYEKLYDKGYLQQNKNFTDDLNETVHNYTNKRPALKAIFFVIDIHRDNK